MFFMFKICVNGERDKYHFLIFFLLHFCAVRGPFSDAQPLVVYWRDDFTRPGFFLGSCVRNSTLGHVVQRLSAYFLSL